MSDKPKFVYVIYIASTPDQVWQALALSTNDVDDKRYAAAAAEAGA
jgi:hypothetical protein